MLPVGSNDSVRRALKAERQIAFDWCSRLGLPLMSPPRAPEAIDQLGREIERLRNAIGWVESEHGIDDDRVREFYAVLGRKP